MECPRFVVFSDIGEAIKQPSYSTMDENPQLRLARRFIETTGTNLFLTGKAGTGKTTFLRQLKANSPKRMVVLAPTGIAALQAGGVTIHSFFQLPLAPYVPDARFTADSRNKYQPHFSREKINIIRSIDLLVIDEVSMVRADLLDAVDAALRRHRHNSSPFGGVQLLLIGDLQQLAPVVKDDEWRLLQPYYDSPYFFSSRALTKTECFTIELTTVYRQQDQAFLTLLNNVRENRHIYETLGQLNTRYKPDFHPRREDGYIRLVTHNAQAQRINDDELSQLNSPSFTFEAAITGSFPEYSYPTDKQLVLKTGAQVMFVKNDSTGQQRYFNGMIGHITHVDSRHIEVKPNEGGSAIELGQEAWTNSRYVLDPETKEIKEEVEGTFSQYPLKLAWAITIHKSQGLTFDRAIIDAAASFAHGQTYVALSRCRTLRGLVLSAPISKRAIITDIAVDQFTDEARSHRPDGERFASLQRTYFSQQVADLFNFQTLDSALAAYVRILDEHLYKLYPKFLQTLKDEQVRLKKAVVDVADRFYKQYTHLINQSKEFQTDPVLQDRITRGSTYFRQQLQPTMEIMTKAVADADNKEEQRKLRDALEELEQLLHGKDTLLEYVANHGFSVTNYLWQKSLLTIGDNMAEDKSNKDTNAKAKKKRKREVDEVPADILHPEFYQRLRDWRKAEAARLNVPPYVILQQRALHGVANLLPTSKRALSRIPYLGKRGIERYGIDLLRLVEEYRKEKGMNDGQLTMDN